MADDGQIDYSELAALASRRKAAQSAASPPKHVQHQNPQTRAKSSGEDPVESRLMNWAKQRVVQREKEERRRTEQADKDRRSQAASLKHVDAMQKRQDAKHAEFERRKKQLEEERLAKEDAELSFQPNVGRRRRQRRSSRAARDTSSGDDPVESRLLNWATMRAAERDREEQRRKEQAKKDRKMGHIPMTNHKRKYGPKTNCCSRVALTEIHHWYVTCRRYVDQRSRKDTANVAGARLYQQGVRWQLMAREQMLSDKERRKAEEDKILRSTPVCSTSALIGLLHLQS